MTNTAHFKTKTAHFTTKSKIVSEAIRNLVTIGIFYGNENLEEKKKASDALASYMINISQSHKLLDLTPLMTYTDNGFMIDSADSIELMFGWSCFIITKAKKPYYTFFDEYSKPMIKVIIDYESITTKPIDTIYSIALSLQSILGDPIKTMIYETEFYKDNLCINTEAVAAELVRARLVPILVLLSVGYHIEELRGWERMDKVDQVFLADIEAGQIHTEDNDWLSYYISPFTISHVYKVFMEKGNKEIRPL